MRKILFLKIFIVLILKITNYKSLLKNFKSLKVFDEKFNIVLNFKRILV